jgi:hypothetical protein
MDKLFDEWFPVQRNNPITIFQKVLECIALHRCVTVEQIIEYLEIQKRKYEDSLLKQHRERTRNQNSRLSDFTTPFERERYQKNDVSEENIIEVIDRHTFFHDYSLDQFLGVSEPEEMSLQYYNFVSHLLIRAIENKTGEKRYELTLFGVILTLTMVQAYSLISWKVFFNQFLNQSGNTNYPSRIALNYKDKLPLIFGKWNLLKDAFFDIDHLMMNFGLVIYKETRKPLILSSVTMGGVKEYYENTLDIASFRSLKLTEIYKSGVSVLKQGKKQGKEIDSDHMLPINKALSNIELRLAMTDLKRFLEYIAEESCTINCEDIITSIENSFADEISFLFYIALARQAEFLPEFKDATIFPSLRSKFISYSTERSNLVRSSHILRSILEDDDEVRKRFSIWCRDSISYEKQIMDGMLNLQREVGLP